MRIKKITNAHKFFEVVNSCVNDVELITSEGDRLNLKSKLCQFISMGQIFSRCDELHLELIARSSEDYEKLHQYFVEFEN